MGVEPAGPWAQGGAHGLEHSIFDSGAGGANRDTVIVCDAQTACEMTNGILANPAWGRTRFRGATNDTRALKKGNAFFCLAGGNADGHQFAARARDLGAGAIFAEKSRAIEWKDWPIPVIGVNDPLTALGDLASIYRRNFKTRYVAITGSVGKTTTKELTAAALAAKYPVFKSPGNFNNLIGIPLALLSRRQGGAPAREIGVLEFGMSTPGEIRRLVEIVGPSWGVVTRIGAAHLLQMKSLAAIAKAKRELFDYADPRMTAFLNSDDPFQRRWMARWHRPTVTYGLDPSRAPDISAADIEVTPRGIRFTVARRRFTLKLAGDYNVPNALAAIAVARHLGVPYEAMIARLARVKPEGDRSRLIRKGGVTLIADCYNANPTSTAAAIAALRRFPGASRRIAVLGAMRELGEHEVAAHHDIGAAAGALDIVVTVGPDARQYRNGAAGAAEWHTLDDRNTVAPFLAAALRPGDVVLFKGSHSERLEEIVRDVSAALVKGQTT